MTDKQPDACPLCQAPAELRKGYTGKESYHWPSLICANGHGFRFYGKTDLSPEDALLAQWNTRAANPAPGDVEAVAVKPIAFMYHMPGDIEHGWQQFEFKRRIQSYEGMSCNEEAAGMIETPLIPLAALTAMTEPDRALREENTKLRRALVDHNDALRSAANIAGREGNSTNWKSFRGIAHYTLAEHHDTVNEARAILASTRDA